MKSSQLKIEIVSFVCFFIMVGAFVLAFSPIVQLKWEHDLTLVLDAAWRLQNGQLPHTDFPSNLGYCFFYQLYVFLKLFNYDIIAVAVATVVFVTALFVIYLCFYRSRTFIANTNFILRLYIFLLIVAIGFGHYNLSWFVADLTYACLYNRYCFDCLLIVMLILCLLQGNQSLTKKQILLVFVIAVLLNYLLFSKITFFIAAAGIIVLFLLLRYLSFNHFKYLVLFFLIVFGTLLLVSRQNFILFLKDYKGVSDIRSNIFINKGFIWEKFWGRYNLILIGAYVFLFAQLIFKKASPKGIILFLAIGAISVFLHFTNSGNLDIVFLTFIPVIFCLPDFIAYRKLMSFNIMLLCCAIFLYKNFRSITLMASAKEHPHRELNSEYVKRFYSTTIIDSCNLYYVTRLEEGVKLINKNLRQGEKVMSFTYDNFYPLLTHTIPPKNNILAWQDGLTYSKTHHPDADKLFSEVNLLLIPKCIDQEAITMSKIYAETVRTRFLKIDESNNCILYRKK